MGNDSVDGKQEPKVLMSTNTRIGGYLLLDSSLIMHNKNPPLVVTVVEWPCG